MAKANPASSSTASVAASTAALPEVISTLKALAQKSRALHTRINAINGEVGALRQAPVSLEDFALYLKKWITNKGENYTRMLRINELKQGPIYPSDGTRKDMSRVSWEELEASSNSHHFKLFPDMSVIFNIRDALPIEQLCFFMPEVVFEKLYAVMKDSIGTRWGNGDVMPVAQRVETIKALNLEQGALEVEVRSIDAEIASASAAINLAVTDAIA